MYLEYRGKRVLWNFEKWPGSNAEYERILLL